MIKNKIWLVFFIMFLFVLSGCMHKNLVTENGNPIPEQFLNMYVFLDYSSQFSDITGNLTSDLYKKNIITEDDKIEIGKIWKKHKKYQNTLQKEVKIWYNKINKGQKYTDKDNIVVIIEKLITETKLLDNLLMEFTDTGKVYLSIVRKIFTLYTEIKGM